MVKNSFNEVLSQVSDIEILNNQIIIKNHLSNKELTISKIFYGMGGDYEELSQISDCKKLNGTKIEITFGSNKKVKLIFDNSEELQLKIKSDAEVGVHFDIKSFWYGEGEIAPRATLNPVYRWNIPIINKWVDRRRQVWPLNKNGYERKNFMIDDNSSVLVPFWLNSNGFGIYMDTYDAFKERFNYNENKKFELYSKEGRDLDIFIIRKKTIKEVYEYWIKKDYHYKEGWKPESEILYPSFYRAPIWQTWAKFKTKIDGPKVMKFAQDIKDSGLPYKVLGIDDMWQTGYGDIAFDQEKFPKTKEFFKELETMGFQSYLWTLNFTHQDTETFKYLEKNIPNGLVRSKDGKVQFTRWWNNFYLFATSGIFDYTNEEFLDWYCAKMDALKKEYNLLGFKCDGGETVYLGKNYKFSKELKENEYTDIYVKNRKRLNSIKFRVARFTQNVKPIIWQYDKNSSWSDIGGLKSVLTQYLSMGMVGYPFVLPGIIGGNLYYFNDKSSELYIRWLQLNTFLPMMQLSVLPWERGEITFNAAKKYLGIFEKLNDYRMKYVKDSHQSGLPIVKPLFFKYPEVKRFYEIDDQFLFGDHILVAPVLYKGMTKRDIYLPKGKWLDFHNKEVIEGDTVLKDYSAPVDILPFFIEASYLDGEENLLAPLLD